MTKQEVIERLKAKQTDSQKFMALLLALQQAPNKNFTLVGSYNRKGYSPSQLKTLKYDVKKAYNISHTDLSAKATKTESKPKYDKEEIFKNLVEVNLYKLDYHKGLKPLAADLAERLGGEPKSLRKADLIDFIEEKKSDLAPQTNYVQDEAQ